MVLAGGDQAVAALDVLRGVGRKKAKTWRVEASEIVPGIWQGSKPPKGHAVAESGFHVLVLCAKEIQPGPEDFPGLETLVSVPMRDDKDAGHDTWSMANRAGAMLAERWKRGSNLLITCHQGWNRSGLVVGMTLQHAFPGVDGNRIVRLIRERRKHALGNERFAGWVARHAQLGIGP
jgi:hypothetical protein